MVVSLRGVESVIFDSWDGNIYSLTLGELGFNKNWSQTLGKSRLMGGGAASSPFLWNEEYLFVGGPTGIWSLSVETGEVRWFYETGDQCGSSPVAWMSENGNARVAIGCEDGYLYILES